MELNWIKIKSEHLSLEYTNAQLGALVRYHMFYAQNGREPTDKELALLIGRRDFARATETMSSIGEDLSELRRKVDLDRVEVQRKREQGKARQSKYRLKSNSDALRNGDVTKQIRLDKIRLDKNKLQPLKFNKEDMQLSTLLRDEIRKNMPTFKEPDLDSWAEYIRLMREVDKRTFEQIEVIIKWCQSSDFWKPNILSTRKLRSKFDTLVGQAKRDIDIKKSKKVKII